MAEEGQVVGREAVVPITDEEKEEEEVGREVGWGEEGAGAGEGSLFLEGRDSCFGTYHYDEIDLLI